MKRRSRVGNLMIMDACVLIDFMNTEPSILKTIVKHVGPLHVTSTIVGEINGIDDESDLIELGLITVEPEIDDAFVASGTGPLSLQDQLYLFTAKRYKFACVTNDKSLRKACEQEGIKLMWGLELIAKLHKAGGITRKDAVWLAKAIEKSNPMHITAEIVARFIKRIRRQEAGSGSKFKGE